MAVKVQIFQDDFIIFVGGVDLIIIDWLIDWLVGGSICLIFGLIPKNKKRNE